MCFPAFLHIFTPQNEDLLLWEKAKSLILVILSTDFNDFGMPLSCDYSFCSYT